MKRVLTALCATSLVAMAFASPVHAKTLKLQSSSKAGDWAHRFMTDDWAPKFEKMTGGELKLSVLPTKAVVPHRDAKVVRQVHQR